MIKSPELEAWLGERDNQRRTHAAINGFARAWGEGPVQRRLDTVMAAVADQDAEAVTEAVRSVFADQAWLNGLLDALAAEMRRDPYFEPPFPSLNSDIQTGLLVFQDDRVSIAAGVIGVAQLAAKKNVPRGAVSISFTGSVSILKIVKSGGAHLSFWEAPRTGHGFTAAQAGRCFRTGGRVLQDGEILVIDGRYQSYVIDHAAADLVVLQASIRVDQAPLSVEYDARTCQCVGASATDDGASRIQNMTTLLRKMECDDAFEIVAQFLTDPNFFVRWHVMRELLGIDAVAALPHLCRLAQHDPHPEVRSAARSVLDGITIRNPALAERIACPA